jgi:UTP--glucose-1-phosphate uridylyltransferase
MIRKAVIPAAGFGTRFLPATKSQPKEMLPIVDTPVIQYVVQEAASAGITDILMVIGKGKRAIEEHFDRNFQLESQLLQQGKNTELKLIQKISQLADIHFVWQKELKGLGDAVYWARFHVNDEPFIVLLGDTIMDADVPPARQLLDVYEKYNQPVVLLEEIDPAGVSRYGVIDGEKLDDGVYKINDFVEKPRPQDAPSNLVIAGRYILTPDIFEYIEQTKPGKGGEIQLTDALKKMVKKRPMYGRILEGKRCDIGNTEGFIKTNIEFALKHKDMSQNLTEYIINLAQKLKS